MDVLVGELMKRAFERIDLFALLLLILWGGAKRTWVYGWQYREKSRDHDYWRDLALQGTGLAENALTLAERKRRHAQDDAG